MPFNILVLCTGNSARSILGEALFNRLGEGRVTAYSAGSHPKGAVHPGALRLLARRGIDTTRFRSKSWDEFAEAGSPTIDIVITVCGNADQEICPVWTGAPVRTHWGLPDPADVTGDEATVDAAFESTWRRLETRVAAFLALPAGQLSGPPLKAALDAIGLIDDE